MDRTAVLARCLPCALLLLPGCNWNWDAYEPRGDAAVARDALDAGPPPDASPADVSPADASDAPTGCGLAARPCCTDPLASPCAAGLACVAGACASCDVGLTACGAACVDTRADPANCGACNRACDASARCVSGVCAPANDARADALDVDLTSAAVTLATDTANARNDATGPCMCADGRDVFFRLTLRRPELVYVDTFGSAFDTAVFLQDASGTNLTDAGVPGGAVCNNDAVGCAATRQSELVALLAAGVYHLVVSGCGGGRAVVHVQHLPVGAGALTALMLPRGVTLDLRGTTAGTGGLSSSCCSDGPEDTFYFTTCPDFTARALYATTCGRASFRTVLNQASAARAPVDACAQDSCGEQALLGAPLPAGAGLHTLVVDGCGGAAGAYTVSVTLGECATGALCSGRCVDTGSSPANCGACGVACPTPPPNAAAGCTSGRCVPTCLPGFSDCNATLDDGCETSLASATDCGACGRACDATHGTPSCDGRACSIVCNAGFGNCDGAASTGCEADLMTDRSNCGACGTRCNGTRYCRSGVCS